MGTMAYDADQVQSRGHPIVRFTDACLRGFSQVFMINNPVTGFFIIIGILCDSWYRFLASLLGAVTATAVAKLLGANEDAIRCGLFGYNGVLTGMAIAVFSFADDHEPHRFREFLDTF